MLLLATGMAILSLVRPDGSFAVDVLPASLIAAAGMALAFIPSLGTAIASARGIAVAGAALAAPLLRTPKADTTPPRRPTPSWPDRPGSGGGVRVAAGSSRPRRSGMQLPMSPIRCGTWPSGSPV